MGTPADDRLLERYLLGDCAEEDQARVEEGVFSDSDTFEDLCELEEELIWRYVRGDLNAPERARFERAYSAPPRRDRLVLTVALGRVLAEGGDAGSALRTGASRDRVTTPDVRTANARWWKRWIALEPIGVRLALAAACAALVIGLTVEVRQTRALRARLEQFTQDASSLRQQAESAARRAAESERRIATLSEEVSRAQGAGAEQTTTPLPKPVFATFVLTPGRTRSARAATPISPAGNVDRLRLQLMLDFEPVYTSFKAELRTSAGDLLWSQDRLQSRRTADGASVVVTVPAALVAEGEYELDLQGHLTGSAIEDAASYFFIVARP